MPRRPRFALPLLLALLTPGCVIVAVEGGAFSEETWLSDVVHGTAMPASFAHEDPDVSFVGTVFGLGGELEMAFACDESELDAYFEGVCTSVERTLEEERHGRIVRVRERGPLRRSFEYDGEGGYGEAKVRIRTREGGDYPYRLVIEWSE